MTIETFKNYPIGLKSLSKCARDIDVLYELYLKKYKKNPKTELMVCMEGDVKKPAISLTGRANKTNLKEIEQIRALIGSL